MRFELLSLSLLLLTGCSAVNTRWYDAPNVTMGSESESINIKRIANEYFKECKTKAVKHFDACVSADKTQDKAKVIVTTGGILAFGSGSTIALTGGEAIQTTFAAVAALAGAGVSLTEFAAAKLKIDEQVQKACGSFLWTDSLLDLRRREVDNLLANLDQYVLSGDDDKWDSTVVVARTKVADINSICKF